jgi:hypothetical protein
VSAGGPVPPGLTYTDDAQRQKILGSLPVIYSFCQRLGIAAIIDDAAPIRDLATVTAGQVAEELICNRLTSPAPLVHVQGWASAWAVEEILGIAPASLNDDKLARTLDAIAPHLEQITSAVAVRAITTFGIDISQLHWDMTSFSMHGAYDETDEDYPEPRYGHPKDRRPDLLQVQAGIAATGDGGIPVYHRAYDDGAAEVSQVSGAMTALKKIAGTRTFLLIGDSKLISYDNVAAITGKGCTFLAPASKTYVKAAELAEVSPHSAVGQAAIRADVEAEQLVPIGVSHDQSAVVRGDGHAVRERDVLGDRPGGTVGCHERNETGLRRAFRRSCGELEVSGVDVGVAVAVDHDVVEPERRQRGQVCVGRQAAVALQRQQCHLLVGDQDGTAAG